VSHLTLLNIFGSFFARGAIVCLYLVLSACGGGGGGSSVATVGQSGSDNPPPIITFSSSDTLIDAGESVTLTWQTSNAASCTASGAWSGSKSISGNEVVGPIQSNQTFILSCSGAGGGSLREVDVQIATGGASVNLTSSQPAVGVNGQVTLTWTSTNAQTCEAEDGWTGPQPLQGTFETAPLTQTTPFKLTCFGQGTSAVVLLTVIVSDGRIEWQAPTENVDGTPLTDLAGYNVHWGAASRNYTNSTPVAGSETEWQATLSSGFYYFAVTALNAGGEESSQSNEVYRYVP